MQSLKTSGQTLFNPQWQGTLSDYVTAVAWSPDGQLAASSAAGEVVLWTEATLTPLQVSTEQSIDCLAFSQDGQFLAAAGQDGRVKIWRLTSPPTPSSPSLRLQGEGSEGEESITPPFPTREGGAGGSRSA